MPIETPETIPVIRVMNNEKNSVALIIEQYLGESIRRICRLLLQDAENSYSTILVTNAMLNDMFLDEKGHWWAVDELGYLYSTMPGMECDHIDADIQVTSPQKELTWATRKISNFSIERVWGIGESKFLFTADNKVLISSDGNQWSAFELDGNVLSINALHQHDIYVGTDANGIFHYDGFAWNKMELPETGLPRVSYNDMFIDDNAEVFALSMNGLIMRGDKIRGFHMMQAPVFHYTGMAKSNNRYFFSAASDGLLEADNCSEPLQLTKLEEANHPLSISAKVDGELLLTIAVQSDKARYIVGTLNDTDGGVNCVDVNFEPVDVD